jgi:hypothetical protein
LLTVRVSLPSEPVVGSNLRTETITGGAAYAALILKPDPTDKTPNHFIVLCDGVQIGRIFDRVPSPSAPRNATWFWSLDGKYRVDAGADGGVVLGIMLIWVVIRG